MGRLVLWRREWGPLRRLAAEQGWLLVYGRRKTGKTFTARLLLPWRLYATVSRDRSVLLERRTGWPKVAEPWDAMRIIEEELRQGHLVVIDEFQRLPEETWERLPLLHAETEGGLVLAASSLGAAKRVFDRRSPLLGLLVPYHLPIISYADVVASLAPRLPPRRAALWGLLLREPWVAALPGAARGDPIYWLASMARLLLETARGLIGEVFWEEDRRLTSLYEAVLRLLGAGVWDAARMATVLHGRGLISTPSPGTVTGVLDKLAEIGLVARTRLWRTRGRRVYYRHASPLLGVLYGLAEKLLLDENPVQPPRRIAEAATMLLARELQFSVGELLAEHHDGVPAYTVLPGGEGDVDAVVLDARMRKALAAYEVKMGKCSRSDLEKAREAAHRAGAALAGAVCLAGADTKPPTGLDVVIDAEGLIRIATSIVSKATKRLRREWGTTL